MTVKFKYIFLIVLVVMVAVIWSSLSDKGINDLSVKFEEKAVHQNENNTGPVRRNYLVAVSDSIWQDLRVYGNYMPYAKLGTTTVWFFMKGDPMPKEFNKGKLDIADNMSVLAKYEKSNMGIVTLTKYPLTNRAKVVAVPR
ncbi:MAG: hypothetical protein HEP71_18285 [Roseivirga sp.]|nr:hypothetical protein [Roseivirga sp.]